MVPNGQSPGYLSWYDVCDEQFETLNLGDWCAGAHRQLLGPGRHPSASPVPVIPADQQFRSAMNRRFAEPVQVSPSNLETGAADAISIAPGCQTGAVGSIVSTSSFV